MPERLVEIIEYLIREISHLPNPHGSDFEKLSKNLKEKGFSELEIKKALEIVVAYLSRPAVSDGEKPARKKLLPIRVLNEMERSYFTREAFGYMIHLQTMRILTPLQIEQIIERSLMMGFGKVTLEDLKTMVTQMMIGREPGNFNTDAVYHPGNESVN